MTEEAWTFWRAANMAVALLGVVIATYKAWAVHRLEPRDLETGLGFLACQAYGVGYVAATAYAWTSGVPAGPWTAIMSVPILWALAAALARPS